MSGRRKRGIPRWMRAEIWNRDAGICQICGQPASSQDWEADHILPWSLGGPDEVANLRVSHAGCNRRRRPPHRMSEKSIVAAVVEWCAREFQYDRWQVEILKDRLIEELEQPVKITVEMDDGSVYTALTEKYDLNLKQPWREVPSGGPWVEREPYGKRQVTLHAEVDEEHWQKP